jgi:hypothetical protein
VERRDAIVAYQNSNAYIFKVSEGDGGDGTITSGGADTFELVMTLTGATTTQDELSNANFVA